MAMNVSETYGKGEGASGVSIVRRDALCGANTARVVRKVRMLRVTLGVRPEPGVALGRVWVGVPRQRVNCGMQASGF